MATDAILVGTDVSVIARERPLAFAHRVATVDRLSGGRLVLGVGIGGAEGEYVAAGEPTSPRERAALTDELLDVVGRLLAGERVTHEGAGATVRGVTLAPLPAQSTVPVWIGGDSAGARRRAARHDGWIPYPFDEQGTPTMTPAELTVHLAAIRDARRAAGIPAGTPFEVGVHGETPPDPDAAGEVVRPWADAGATWWLESLHGYRGSTDELVARVAAGPPTLG
jgi:alkanesulfonate monooxygenase SsuD/methylene tetrahydromethanopterin reductase-like flavin-dependent oxidoreductase (luciferase family)